MHQTDPKLELELDDEKIRKKNGEEMGISFMYTDIHSVPLMKKYVISSLFSYLFIAGCKE